ncbi:hypothetical protein Hanom_Chr14g01247731 [Helianthus anomalus]
MLQKLQFQSQSILTPIAHSPSKTPPSPKFVYTRKRKFTVHEENIPTPTPLSSSPFIQTSPKSFIPPSSLKTNPLTQPPTDHTPRDIPLAVQYPLELPAVQSEMLQFYIEHDPSKRTFPSLHGFRTPRYIDEYLKLKAKQVEYIAKEESKGLGDTNLSSRMQHGLSKVRKLEVFARDLSKKMSN